MKTFATIIILLILAACNSQITITDTRPAAKISTVKNFPSFQWGSDFFSSLGLSLPSQGAGAEYVDVSTKDAQGNVYIAGSTYGNLVENNGGGASSDIFITKYSPSGEKLWIKQIGAESAVPGNNNTSYEYCSSLAVDNNGYLYCAGSTGGSIGEANTNHRSDMLLIKLNALTGTVVWYKQWGQATGAPSGYDTGMNDWFDDVKFYNGKLYFCASSSSYFAETGNGLYDIIAGRMDLNGNFEWIKQIGTTTAGNLGVNMAGRDYGGKIALDGTHLYCGGSTNANFSENIGGAPGTYDMLFVKYEMATGAIVGYKQFGATTLASFGANAGDEYGCVDLEFDNNGDLICLSQVYGNMSDVDAGNSGDILVIKLDKSLNPIWVTQLGSNAMAPFTGDSSGYDWGERIAINAKNEIVVGGNTYGNLIENNVGSLGDAIVMKISPLGAIMDVKHFGSLTPIGNSDNSGYDECNLETINSKIYCIGINGGSAFDTAQGTSGDLTVFPIEF